MEDKLVPAGAADDVWRTEWLHMMEYIPKHFSFHSGEMLLGVLGVRK